MRNIVGHGLNSDKELQSSASLATWWFTLKICCMYSNELAIRLNKQIEEKIEHVYSVTEEVTAGAEETLEECNRNLESVNYVVKIMEHLREDANRLQSEG